MGVIHPVSVSDRKLITAKAKRSTVWARGSLSVKDSKLWHAGYEEFKAGISIKETVHTQGKVIF